MQLEITALFASILGIFLMILSFRVISLRGSPVAKLINKKNRVVSEETLQRAIRGHGNLTEYVPLFLILMLIAEFNQTAQQELIAAGIIFTVGRLMHGIVFAFLQPNMFMRVGGMVLTFTGFFWMFKCNAVVIFG